ncbi:MAG: YlbF family regulator [Firmicutes bacterium]|nr:YlbF family regulator [Bacillota bacterium]
MSMNKSDRNIDKESICAQAAILGEMLTQSAEYRQYQEAKRNLLGDRDRSYILSLLRQQQMSLRLAQILGVALDDAEGDLEQLYETFCLEPVVCDFLYAEGRLGRLISEVQKVCGNKLDLWIENDVVEHVQNRELN